MCIYIYKAPYSNVNFENIHCTLHQVINARQITQRSMAYMFTLLQAHSPSLKLWNKTSICALLRNLYRINWFNFLVTRQSYSGWVLAHLWSHPTTPLLLLSLLYTLLHTAVYIHFKQVVCKNTRRTTDEQTSTYQGSYCVDR